MKRGVKMNLKDAMGLPNVHGAKRQCPVCGRRPKVRNGGVVWKWLAIHLAKHMGWEWGERGFV